jgi:hypothetical protein
MTNILIVLSAADKWTRADGSIYESGVWAQEFVDLDEAFVRAGFEVDLASPSGIVPTMDKRSLDPNSVGGADRRPHAGLSRRECFADRTAARARQHQNGRL